MAGTHTPEYQRAWYARSPEARVKARERARRARLLKRLQKPVINCISCKVRKTLKARYDAREFRMEDRLTFIGRTGWGYFCRECYEPLLCTFSHGSGRKFVDDNPKFEFECLLLVLLVKTAKLNLGEILVSAGIYDRGRLR